ncbi:MAG TPA: NAD(+) synthase [Fibrobacteria bacterium]|nr:NAD(+) synthase [Fibrobacteria bacterium]
MAFTKENLKIDLASEAARIGETMKRQLRELRRKGVVLGLSGGIDSSVTAALAVKALGKERVFGIFMPEHDSDPETLRFSRMIAEHLGIETTLEDISPALEAVGCYRRRNEAVATVIPGFNPDWKFKIVLPGPDHAGLNFFSVVARSPEGLEVKERLPLHAYLTIVAATNFKQRIRKMLEYYYADSLNFAVAGTPNRLEYDQGFFVKQGDGSADVKPIAHLYKSQVYDMAEYLGVPEPIRRRPPTTDTYSMPQSQEEFYFALPYDKMDLVLCGYNQGAPAAEIALAAGLTEAQVLHAFKDVETKRSTTRYQHLKPLLVEEIPNVG